jgi:hypothetical protein
MIPDGSIEVAAMSTEDPRQWIRPAAAAGMTPLPTFARPLEVGSSIVVPARLAIAGVALVSALELGWSTAEVVTGRTDVGDSNLSLLFASADLVALGLAGAAFISWLYLGYRNVHGWGIRGLRWSQRWAIGGWFVPFANFGIPGSVVGELRRAGRTPPGMHVGSERSTLIRAWWTFFVASRVLGFVANRADTKSVGLDLAASLLLAAAGVLAVPVIRDITDAQQRHIAALSPPA